MKITLNDFYEIQKTSSECKTIGEWKTEHMIMDDIFNRVGVDERVQTVQVVDLTHPEISSELSGYANDRLDFVYHHGNLELLKSYGGKE